MWKRLVYDHKSSLKIVIDNQSIQTNKIEVHIHNFEFATNLCLLLSKYFEKNQKIKWTDFESLVTIASMYLVS